MGVMSKGMMPVCDSVCVCCPVMRPRSRHPVKRYKKLLAEIIPKNMEEEPNHRKIGKLCEYISKNPLRLPKITSLLEQRCYRELRSENIKSAKVIICIYQKLIGACKQQMPLFSSSFLSIIHILLDQTRHDELQIIGCIALFDFINNQLCLLAQEMGNGKRVVHLRCAGLQALSSMIWFMGEFCHISTDLDNVVSVILENCHPKESTCSDNSNQVIESNEVRKKYKVENQVTFSSDLMARNISWRMIVNERDKFTMADTGSPIFWSRVCLHNMAKLAREATTVRRVLEALFHYFDNGNLWSPDHGLAHSVLMDMQAIIETSGHNTHFLLSSVIKHLDHKNVLRNPMMQIDIIQVATSLAQVSQAQLTVTIVGAFNDMLRHLCSLDDSDLGHKIIQWNKKFQPAIDECLVQLSYKIGDAGPILDVMAVMLESISNITVMARNTIAAVYRAAQIVAFLPNLFYQNKAFPEALFHQILMAMVIPDHETRLEAHRIFSVVLVPSSVCPPFASTSQFSASRAELVRTLSRSVSAFSSSAALFEKLIKEQNSSLNFGDQVDQISIDTEGKTKNQSMLARLTSSYSRKIISSKSHAFPTTADFKKKEVGISLKLRTRQISLLLSSIWVQAISNLNTPANYEAIAHTYGLVMLFSQSKKSSQEILIRSFQLALSLRNISLEGGLLQPSRRRSLFTLAMSMIIILSKAYNFLPLIASAKAVLTDKMVDPFLQLVDDCKLKALDDKIEVNDAAKTYGSKEDDEDALKSLSTIKISEDQSTESFASIIVETLGMHSNVERSTLKEQLLKDFLPDDVCPLGAQLVFDNVGEVYQSESKESEAEHLIFANSDDLPNDSNVSHTESSSQMTLESPRVLSVNQFLDMVTETTKEVGRSPLLIPSSDLPFKDMASQCEARQMGKQQVLTHFLAAQSIQESSASFCARDGVQVHNKLSNVCLTSPSITGVPMPCAAETNSFTLPASTPYDNFLKAAGGLMLLDWYPTIQNGKHLV